MEAPTAILVIEDEQFLRNLISEKLRHEGYAVRAAIDGEDGLRMAREAPPALILLDLLLPGIDGFEVLRRLKKDRESAGVPVLVLSNLGQREDIDRAMALGAEGFLIKANFTPGQVVEKIKGVLNKSYM
jgi:DNA-binding response OmpR family regulator